MQHVRTPRTTRRSAHGFTLIELMVALVVGMVLVVAVLKLQLQLTRQNVRTADTGVRDNEIRAAMDLITQDLASGGFLGGGAAQYCTSILSYDSNAAGISGNAGYYPSFSAWAMTGVAGAALPMLDQINSAKLPGGTWGPSYPAAGGNRSDILFLRTTSDATSLANLSSTTTKGSANATYPPLTQQAYPLANSCNFNVGDAALVQATVSGTRFCMRMPVAAIAAPCGNNTISNGAGASAFMPATFFTGFSNALNLVGGTAGSLTNDALWTAKVQDIGTAAATTQVIYAYYVDSNAAIAPWPVLIRAAINPLNDQVISSQIMASGVVSLQVMFGLAASAGSTGVVSYVNTANMTAAQWPLVLTTKILLVSRSLTPDPGQSGGGATASYQFNNNGAASLPVSTQYANASYPGTKFTDYTFSASEQHQHFTTQMVEISMRNNILSNN